MSKKKPVDHAIPSAKYRMGQKVYTIQFHKDLPEELLEGEVVGLTSSRRQDGVHFISLFL
jgi:hypothetical protein